MQIDLKFSFDPPLETENRLDDFLDQWSDFLSTIDLAFTGGIDLDEGEFLISPIKSAGSSMLDIGRIEAVKMWCESFPKLTLENFEIASTTVV